MELAMDQDIMEEDQDQGLGLTITGLILGEAWGWEEWEWEEWEYIMEDILEDTTMVEVILGVFDYNQFIFVTFCLIFSPFLSLKGFLIDQLM